MSRRLIVVALLVVFAPSAFAQRFGEPSYWLSGGVGLNYGFNVADPKTHGTWEVAGAPQLRGALELPLPNGASFGLAGTYSGVGLTFAGDGTGACAVCDAHMTVTQALALFRVGGGNLGFHSVLEIQLGAISFAGLKASDGTSLGMNHPIIDPTFTLDYGFGYEVSPKLQVEFTEELGTMLHARVPGGGQDNIPRFFVTRFGLRFGLGGS